MSFPPLPMLVLAIDYIFNEIYFKTLDECQAVVAHAFNPSTLKAEAGGFSGFQGQPGLQSEFQESQG